jgi:hypothetical protein
MSTDYADRWITASGDGIKVRFYYFPFGTKTIPYDAIRSIKRVNMGALTGRARIWGTGSFRYWASLDPQRPRKQIAYIVDTGHAVKPFLTPADPAAFEAAVGAHSKVEIDHGGRSVLI